MARRNNPWRDLAASIADQVNEAVQQSRRGGKGPGATPGSSWGSTGGAPSEDRQDPPGRAGDHTPYQRWGEQAPDGWTSAETSSGPASWHGGHGAGGHARPDRVSGGDLSQQLRGLLSETMGATTETIKRKREERKRTEPIRRARAQSVRSKVAAGAFGVVGLFGLSGVALGVTGENDAPAVSIVLGSTMAVAGGGLATRSGLRARRYTRIADRYEEQLVGPTDLGRMPAPAAIPTVVSLPPESSAAYEPMRRLRAQEQVLGPMLPELLTVQPDLGAIADESEQSLTQLAGRITMLEQAIGAAGSDADLSGLAASVERMVGRLDDGVRAHERLVANAASVLAELSGPTPGPTPVSGLREAADGLQALAHGMREVSRPTAHLAEPPYAGPADRASAPDSAVDSVPDIGPVRDADRRRDRDRRSGT